MFIDIQARSHFRCLRLAGIAPILLAAIFAASGQTPTPTPGSSPAPTPGATPTTVPDTSPTPVPKVKASPEKGDQNSTNKNESNPDSIKSAPDKTDPDTGKAKAQKKEKRGAWIFAPIPVLNPTLGSGLILGVGYVFKLKKNDNKSPPSVIGGGGAFTNNGSRGFAIGGRLKFAENKYDFAFGLAKGKLRYDFFGIGILPGSRERPVRIRQDGQIFFTEFLVNVGKKIFIGPRYQYRKLAATQPQVRVLPVSTGM